MIIWEYTDTMVYHDVFGRSWTRTIVLRTPDGEWRIVEEMDRGDRRLAVEGPEVVPIHPIGRALDADDLTEALLRALARRKREDDREMEALLADPTDPRRRAVLPTLIRSGTPKD